MIKLTGQAKVIMSNPDSIHHYFGWPTVSRLKNGKIAIGASGFRLAHVCPFGKAVMSTSDDEGESYCAPYAVIDTVLDDRDAGLCPFGESGLIFTSFNNTVDFQKRECPETDYCYDYLSSITPDEEEKALGSTFRISCDNGNTFGEIFHSPITSPHGPFELDDSTVLWVGTVFDAKNEITADDKIIKAYRINTDTGEMTHIGSIEPIYRNGTELLGSYEPHTVALPDGSLICHIRVENKAEGSTRVFTVYQSESHDKGCTWTKPHRILSECGGAPSHITVHSSGKLIATYGYRKFPYGIKAMISDDNGKTWSTDHLIYSNEISDDIGYPSTVELSDSSLITVFYACAHEDGKAVIMQQKWMLED